jgi:secernin
MCDTLCIVGDTGTLFGKNSDRPPREPQVVEPYGVRAAGGVLRTQYLELPDPGAAAVLLSRPAWLWGAEHGVNEHRVAIGNEKVWTVDDAKSAPPALLGMDLVRLALERSRTADEALDQLTTLLEAHGQGGSGEEDHDEPYFSSFLIADPEGGWIVETSQGTWAAKPLGPGGAISNRISLTTDWTRASEDVAPGRSFQDWRDPKAPTGIADRRLAATDACVAQGFASPATVGPRSMVATLRHHGTVAWGAPGADAGDGDGGPECEPVPTEVDGDWNGITVCMHLRDYQATTASMVAELPRDPAAPLRAWVALGSPCVSVYVPVFPPGLAPAELASVATWNRFAALRDRVEADPDALAPTRAALASVEADLWDAADDAYATGSEARLERAVASSWAPIDAALAHLGV